MLVKYSRNEEHTKIACLDIILYSSYFYALQNKHLELALKLSEYTLSKEGGSPAYLDTYGYILGEIRRSGSSVEIPGESFDSEVDALGLSWIFGRALSGGGAYEYAMNIAAGQRSSAAEGFDDGDEDFVHLRFGAGVEQLSLAGSKVFPP